MRRMIGALVLVALVAAGMVVTTGPVDAESTKLGPFPSSSALVSQQYADFTGRVPSSGERGLFAGAIDSGSLSVPKAIDLIAGQKGAADIAAPMGRLYTGYFSRLPDDGGLRYWLGQMRGGLALNAVSGFFAQSTEFKSTYGSLANPSFVDLVYQNVLHRAPDAQGRAYWIYQLAAGLPRGNLMTLFSESAENQGATATSSMVMQVWFAMYGALPSATDFAALVQTWSGKPRVDLIASVFNGWAYRFRFGIAQPTPTTPQVIVGNRELTVRWTPAVAHGTAMTGYVVSLRKNGVVQTSRSFGSTTSATFTTFTGLDPTATYTATVRPSTVFGDGPESAPSDAEVPSTRMDPATYHQGPAHDGRAKEPLAANPQVTWTKDLGSALSYPVVGNGRVFVTRRSTTGYYGTELFAFDQATGAQLWGPIALGGAYGFSGLAYEDHKLFALNHDGQIYAFDEATGSQLWSIQAPGQYSFTSIPTAYRGLLYVMGAGSGGTLYAIDEANGQVRWTAGVNGTDSGPAVDADGVYVSLACGWTYRFDPRSGSRAWLRSTGCSGGGGATPALVNGRLYIRDDVYPNSHTVLDAANGQTIGTFESGPMPAFENGLRYEMSSSTLRAVDESTGQVLWSSLGTGGYVSAPMAVNGLVVEISATGVVDARNGHTGAIAWSRSTGVAVGAPDEFNANERTGAAIADGSLFISAEDTLVAIS